MAEKAFVTCFQVRYNSVVLWDQWQGAKPGRKLSDEPVPLHKTAYSGDITEGSRKRLKRCLDLLLQLSPRHYETNPATKRRMLFQLAFITLTVSSKRIISHREAHKTCLARFTRYLRSLGATYIWKAELQKSGQIHYHITINKTIHHADIREKWNSFQKDAGYLQEFEQEHGHDNPNSTDIHAVATVRDLQAYICKYISKGTKVIIEDYSCCDASGKPAQKEVVINGKVWDCSNELKKIKMYQSEDDFGIWEEAGKYGTQKSLDQCGIVLQVQPESYLTDYHKRKYNKWKRENMEKIGAKK